MYDGLATPAAPSTGLDLNTIAGLIVWSDATSYTSGQTLTAWINKAKTTTYTTSCTGTVVMASLNSLPIVRITTSSTWLVSPTPSLPAYTIFWMGRQSGGANGRVLNSSGNQLYGYWNGYKNVLYTEGWLTGQSTGSDTNWDLYTIVRTSSGSGSFSRYGVNISTFSSSGSGMNGLNINSYEQSNAEAAEIILFNVDLSAANCSYVEGYLAWKWGLQANLPSNHPYKSAAP
jgi:hypothetical protein